ncbi:MAG TPA: acyl-CoA dehydrogenase family protein [Dehalococcoidia bacterium]
MPGDIGPPEPDLTADDMVRRAVAMRDALRAGQAECEEIRRIPAATHTAFVDAGFYRVLQPRRFGGYEFDVPSFLRIMIEAARGCPSCGWVLALTSGHTHTLSFFALDVQSSVYGATGDARVPFCGNPGGSATPVDGGYMIRGNWDYASGCDIATHFLCAAVLLDRDGGLDTSSGGPDMALALLNPDELKIVDNWDTLGMRGTGSKRLAVKGSVIPAERLVRGHMRRGPGGHPNPMYSGRILSLLMSEIAAVATGIAWAALDEYETILRDRRIANRPFSLRFEHHEYQHHFGEAWALVETAESALLDAGRRYMQWSRAHIEQNDPFTDEKDQRLLLVEQRVVRLAADAVELLFRTAGSRSTRRGERLERYMRDVAELRTHGGLQHDRTMEQFGRIHFGLPAIPGT